VKDYYRVLGVLDDAEGIIIRAAYKALAQRYHPDKWAGDKEQANKKMSEVNEAYEVLSDPSRRKSYDEEYFRFRAKNESSEGTDDESNFVSEEDENWQMALEFFPRLKEFHEELSKYSGVLANTFKVSLITSKNFKDGEKLKLKLSEEYFNRYYGEDKIIHRHAKSLLLKNEKAAAIEINKILRYMGASVDASQIRDRILEKFKHIRRSDLEDLDFFHHKIANDSITEKEITNLLELLGATNISVARYGNFVFQLNKGPVIFSRPEAKEFLLKKLFGSTSS
jgi:curved DNA-binding protein CbpA